MKKYYRLQLEYNEWANLEYAKYLCNHKTGTSKSIKLLSHIANAHHLWNSRINGSTCPYGVWQIHKPGEMEGIIKSAVQDSLQILQTQRVETIIDYQNTKGEPFSSAIWEIFTHVNAHCNYHRGQMAMDLREHSIAPPYTDYIHYRRSVVKK